jgi:hypothetical protein
VAASLRQSEANDSPWSEPRRSCDDRHLPHAGPARPWFGVSRGRYRFCAFWAAGERRSCYRPSALADSLMQAKVLVTNPCLLSRSNSHVEIPGRGVIQRLRIRGSDELWESRSLPHAGVAVTRPSMSGPRRHGDTYASLNVAVMLRDSVESGACHAARKCTRAAQPSRRLTRAAEARATARPAAGLIVCALHHTSAPSKRGLA